MRRLGFGLFLVGLAVVAHAAPPGDFFVSDPDLLMIRPVRSNTGWLPPYRFSASVVLTRSADTAPVGLGFSNTSLLTSFAEPKKETRWTSTARWELISISGDGRASLSPIQLDDSKREQIEIKPQRRSIWMVWRRAIP